jgi:nucleotide-binding universal stress UspA family protein
MAGRRCARSVTGMFGNVLVGVDGRKGGRDAMALARQLCSPDASVTLAHICDKPENARTLLERERAAAGFYADYIAETSRSVARGLHTLAERGAIDLIVVGSCHRGVLGRVLAGDDAKQTLDHAPCPVAIAPAGYAATDNPLSRLGVGYDGSPEAAHALALARDIQASNGRTLEAMLVLPSQARPYGEPAARWPEVAALLPGDEAEQRDALAGLEATVSYGAPGPALAGFSESLDLLIIGRRAGGRVKHMDGSRSTYLGRHAACPVLVVGQACSSAS